MQQFPGCFFQAQVSRLVRKGFGFMQYKGSSQFQTQRLSDAVPARYSRLRIFLNLLVSCVVFIVTFICVLSFYLYRGSGNMAVAGTLVFRYFTIDSNILYAFACLLSIPVLIRGLISGTMRQSYALLILRYVGTAAVTLTLLTVLFFLGPIHGYAPMFAGFNLYLHLIGPLLAILSLFFLDEPAIITKRYIFLSVLPMLCYGAVYLYQVVGRGPARGGWPDFYGFNRGGYWPVALLAMTAASSVIGTLLLLGHNLICSRMGKSGKR